MSRLVSLCVLLIAVFCTGCGAVTSEILQPIRSSGEEVALIFIPGAQIKWTQYRDIAQAIQKSTDLRVWVALTRGYMVNMPTPPEVSWAINGAITALKQAGFKGKNYVGVGHSVGGLQLQGYAKSKESKLKAVVLMASHVSDTKLKDYPVPVLTLAAELDGQTRITRIVDEYDQLLEDVKIDKRAMYRTPVICIGGANHGQFASGVMPARVRSMNPKPDVSESEVRAMVAKYISSFLIAAFSKDTSLVEAAQKKLEDSFLESGRIFQPLLDMKALHELDGSCSWARIAQEYIARDFVDNLQVNVQVLKRFNFANSTPSIFTAGETVVINITALIRQEMNPLNIPSVKQSPIEIDLKLKSPDAIREALGLGPALLPSCCSLNELALQVALNSSTSEARERYNSRGRPIIFECDIVSDLGPWWALTPLQYKEDKGGLHVQAVALNRPLSSSTSRGNFYCKVMPPYRALEWVILDSLKPV